MCKNTKGIVFARTISSGMRKCHILAPIRSVLDSAHPPVCIKSHFKNVVTYCKTLANNTAQPPLSSLSHWKRSACIRARIQYYIPVLICIFEVDCIARVELQSEGFPFLVYMLNSIVLPICQGYTVE